MAFKVIWSDINTDAAGSRRRLGYEMCALEACYIILYRLAGFEKLEPG